MRPLVSLAVVLIAAAGNAQEKPTADPILFRVAGYLPEYRAAEFDPAAAKQLTDLILFSAEPTAAGTLDLSRLKGMPWADLRSFKTRYRVRLMLCVGGWERSKQFAAAAGSEKARAEFVKAAVRVCLDERLDGLDLDWEHPQTDAEQKDYAALLAELRAGFKPHGLALSVTMAAWQKLPRAAFDSVDWVNLMAYDHPDRHSTLDAARADVKKVLDAGAKAEQITLGIPLYGRDRDNPERAVAYRELLAKNRLEANADEAGRIYFNGLATVRQKTEFAAEAKLAGVMVWEMGQDATGEASLVRAIRSAADRAGRK